MKSPQIAKPVLRDSDAEAAGPIAQDDGGEAGPRNTKSRAGEQHRATVHVNPASRLGETVNILAV